MNPKHGSVANTQKNLEPYHMHSHVKAAFYYHISQNHIGITTVFFCYNSFYEVTPVSEKGSHDQTKFQPQNTPQF